MRRFYDRYILPRLIHLAMSREDIARLRAANVPAAYGVVLEVGIGSGLNLPFYSSAVTRLYGVDTSEDLLKMARPGADRAAFPVELIAQSAERLPLDDTAIDTIVVTWSLCSIPDPAAALMEMRRVMKPGGSLIFVEHGLSPDAGIQAWQNCLTPTWRRLAGGCHLNRKVDELIRSSGFEIHDLSAGYLPGPRPMTFTYQGRATIDHGPSTIDHGPPTMDHRPSTMDHRP